MTDDDDKLHIELRDKLKHLVDQHHLTGHTVDSGHKEHTVKGRCVHGYDHVLWRSVYMPEYETREGWTRDPSTHEMVRHDWSRPKGGYRYIDDVHKVFSEGYHERPDGRCYFCGREPEREREDFDLLGRMVTRSRRGPF